MYLQVTDIEIYWENVFLEYQYCELWRTQEFCSGVVQQIQSRTGDRENGDLGGGSPLVRGSGGSRNLVQEI